MSILLLNNNYLSYPVNQSTFLRGKKKSLHRIIFFFANHYLLEVAPWLGLRAMSIFALTMGIIAGVDLCSPVNVASVSVCPRHICPDVSRTSCFLGDFYPNWL